MSRGFQALPPAQRQLAASIGSLTRWSRVTTQEDRTAALAPARAARQRQWERKADPDGVLSPAELAAAVDRLKRAHYKAMALASAKKRGSQAA
ncbi:hypothetical protein JNW90_19915 [Micromonospora sp. STR1s_5]|nr:hypothetical protein [Micromonospora sp. STR1s_5]